MSSAHKVGELFKTAGQYFSELGDAAAELQLVLDQNSGTPYSTIVKSRSEPLDGYTRSILILPKMNVTSIPVNTSRDSVQSFQVISAGRSTTRPVSVEKNISEASSDGSAHQQS